MRSHLLTSAVALTLVAFSASSLLATPALRAPEIDGTSVSTGVGVLVSSLLILRARWHRK